MEHGIIRNRKKHVSQPSLKALNEDGEDGTTTKAIRGGVVLELGSGYYQCPGPRLLPRSPRFAPASPPTNTNTPPLHAQVADKYPRYFTALFLG